MKNLSVFLVLSLTLLIATCRKAPLDTNPVKPKSLQNAENFFNHYIDTGRKSGVNSNYRSKIPKSVLWENAKVVPLSIGNGVIVPVHYQQPLFAKTSFGGNNFFNLDSWTSLLIYQDIHRCYHAELVTAFPDTDWVSHPSGNFSGIRLVEDWFGQLINKYKYSHNIIYKYTIAPGTKEIEQVVTLCSEIDGYNYAEDDPDNGYQWEEDGGCTTTYLPDNPSDGISLGGGDYGGGGGGGSSTGPVIAFMVNSATNPIANFADYIKCFTNVGGSDHTYTVTVCVDQPDPGNRTPWSYTGIGSNNNLLNPISVGHAFLVLTEKYGGTTITRNVGFYPGGLVWPENPRIQGMLNDDENHGYDISGSFTVTNAQFFNILIFLGQGNTPGYDYDLNTNNCTSFVIHALVQGDVQLPSTVGVWPDGSGNDPGDLGEDLRTRNVPGMTRNTVFGFHPNVGNCL